MENTEKKIPDNLSEIMKGLKSSIPDLKGLGNYMKMSVPDILTPPMVDYNAINKATSEAFKKKRQDDNIKFWLIIVLNLIGILIMTFTYFKN
jgi:hypothetical protein